MQSNIIKSNKKVYKLLNELLKERLEPNLTNLEKNNKEETASLFMIKTTSNDLINSLSQLSKNFQEKENIKIPKLKIDNIISNQNTINTDKNKESFIEIESILKNKKYHNKRNKEESICTLYLENTKVSFLEKSKNSINKTPDKSKTYKSFISNTTKKKENNFKSKILTENNSSIVNTKNRQRKSNSKCITDRNKKEKRLGTPITIKNKNHKSKFLKKGYKTAINFYNKKNKSIHNNSVNDFKLDLSNEKIKEDEKNLNLLCDSLLLDVNKDELLVNTNSKIIINDNFGNEISLRKENKSSLYEKFIKCIQYILKYLNIHDIFNIYQTKKEILKIVLNNQIKDLQNSINKINSCLKNKNINKFNLSQQTKPFVFSSNSIKALSLLNSISKDNFIKSIMNYNKKNSNNNNINAIILIFDLYFISIGKKKILNKLLENKNKKIEYICNYFKNNKNKSLGIIIANDLKGKKFDDLIINSLYELSYKYINIINPNYYKKINKDIAILVFIIKNILDYIGLSNFDLSINKNNEDKFVSIWKSRLNIKKILLEKFNHLLNKFN